MGEGGGATSLKRCLAYVTAGVCAGEKAIIFGRQNVWVRRIPRGHTYLFTGKAGKSGNRNNYSRKHVQARKAENKQIEAGKKRRGKNVPDLLTW